MSEWAEATSEDVPAPDNRTTPAPTLLRITRIGAAVAPAPVTEAGAPVDLPPATAQAPSEPTQAPPAAPLPSTPGIASRLRATDVTRLSPSDRARLSILRAKARSLRDRLASPLRSGA